MTEKYIKLDDILALIEKCRWQMNLSHYFGVNLNVVVTDEFLGYLRQLPTIDVEEANEKKLTEPEVVFYLKRCKGWFPPYTPEVEKWNEAIDEAIEALKERKEREEE